MNINISCSSQKQNFGSGRRGGGGGGGGRGGPDLVCFQILTKVGLYNLTALNYFLNDFKIAVSLQYTFFSSTKKTVTHFYGAMA